MPDQPSGPEPTERDRENAAVRDAIARKQAEDYGQCLRWALGQFGPGWAPSCRHMLISKEEEEKHRRTGEPAIPAATVYTVKHERTGDRRHFMVGEDGTVTEVASYQEGFGPMLLEPDPVHGFTDREGVFRHVHRYSLCWAGYELYHPRTADQLARQRQTRERNKAAQEQKRWAEENPLLAWADRQNEQEDMPGGTTPPR